MTPVCRAVSSWIFGRLRGMTAPAGSPPCRFGSDPLQGFRGSGAVGGACVLHVEGGSGVKVLRRRARILIRPGPRDTHAERRPGSRCRALSRGLLMVAKERAYRAATDATQRLELFPEPLRVLNTTAPDSTPGPRFLKWSVEQLSRLVARRRVIAFSPPAALPARETRSRGQSRSVHRLATPCRRTLPSNRFPSHTAAR